MLERHALHVALPASALNVFATHCPHAPPSGPVHPALHRQAPTATLPGSESEFSGHSAQAEDHTFTSQRESGRSNLFTKYTYLPVIGSVHLIFIVVDGKYD